MGDAWSTLKFQKIPLAAEGGGGSRPGPGGWWEASCCFLPRYTSNGDPSKPPALQHGAPRPESTVEGAQKVELTGLQDGRWEGEGRVQVWLAELDGAKFGCLRAPES